METLNIIFKHPLTNQSISIAQGIIDQNIIDLETKYIVDNSIVNSDYFRRTGKTFIDPQRGMCEYIALVNPQDNKVINPEIGWIYIKPNQGMDAIKGFFGFFKNSHNGLEFSFSGAQEDTALK